MGVREDRRRGTVLGEVGADMREVPQQGSAAAATLDPEELIGRLSHDLERTISFAEECRWRFPELSAEADQLAAEAMALFGKTMRSMRGVGGGR
jgi:hypothetical protein